MSDAGARRRSRRSCERIGAHRERVLKRWRPRRRSQQARPTCCRQGHSKRVAVKLTAENGIYGGLGAQVRRWRNSSRKANGTVPIVRSPLLSPTFPREL